MIGNRKPRRSLSDAVFHAILLPAVLVFISCADQSSTPRPGRGAESRAPAAAIVEDIVVAEVDGVPVFGRDVAALVAASDGGVGIEEAARALVDNELLAREAAARGWGDDEEVVTARARRMARLLLEREVGAMTPDDIPTERLREVYERDRARFDRGPTRVVIHFVARTPKKDPQAARRLSDLAAAAVADATDEETFREALAPLVAEHGNNRLVVEKLPPFTADDTRFVAPFVEAAFAIPGPGQFSGPVETRFGWHGILLLEELPPVRIPFDEARSVIAREILVEEQKQAFERLLADLERRVRPLIDEAAVLAERRP